MRKSILSILALLLAATSTRADWTGGTYTATSDENLNAIVVSSDATLTINSGVTVTISRGINVTDGATLTIAGSGTLVVKGTTGGNGSDASFYGTAGGNGGNAISGNVIVQSGTVNATGGNGGNGGRGSSSGGNGGNGGNAFAGTLTSYGGTVTAIGGKGGNGGDANFNGSTGGKGGNAFTGTLTYYGGTVNATGGNGGAAGSAMHRASAGSRGNAFANGVDFQTTYALTNGTTTISSVTNQRTVVISEAPASYDVTASLADGAYWSTFYSNAANYQAPEGTQMFIVNLDGTTLTMTEITDRIVKSGEGVVLKSSTTGSGTMTWTESTPGGDFSHNSLTGTMTSITNPGNAFVLNGKSGVGFYKLSSGGTIGANKAYLTYSGSNARETFFFNDVTSVNGVRCKTADVRGEYYDLQGRRVAHPMKGLYIVDGKKVVIE